MVDIILHFQKKFAQQPELCEDSKPFSQSPFTLSFNDEADYHLWCLTPQPNKMANWLREQITIAENVPQKTHEGIDFYQSGTSKGFRLHPALTKFSDSYCRHFFFFLKQLFLENGYKIQVADKRLFKRSCFDETVCRFILKPVGDNAGSFQQIKIEMLSKNNHLALLHVDTTASAGEMPHATNRFAELLERVLTF